MPGSVHFSYTTANLLTTYSLLIKIPKCLTQVYPSVSGCVASVRQSSRAYNNILEQLQTAFLEQISYYVTKKRQEAQRPVIKTLPKGKTY